MKNPLVKRIPRELKSDFGKYAVIFLFMVMLISLVSGFLVADSSIKKAYDTGFETHNVEDGHITFDKELPQELLEKIEQQADIRLYDMKFFEEDSDSEGKTSRVYLVRDIVNTECLMEGEMPEKDDEIAIDRMFANNNSIKIGDSFTLNGKPLTISGFIALPDYSSLYESNTDMMFDAINFNVGIMTKNGWNNIGSKHIFYNYAWKYNEALNRNDTSLAKEKADDLIDILKDVITEYDMMVMTDASKVLKVTDFLPEYQNNAILFAGEDMGSDKAMFILFDYRQYRTKIVRKMRRQIFRQNSQKDRRHTDVCQGVFGDYDGKYASRFCAKPSGGLCAVLPILSLPYLLSFLQLQHQTQLHPKQR